MPATFTGWGIIWENSEDNDNDGEGILDGAPWDGVWDGFFAGVHRWFRMSLEPQAGAHH